MQCQEAMKLCAELKAMVDFRQVTPPPNTYEKKTPAHLMEAAGGHRPLWGPNPWSSSQPEVRRAASTLRSLGAESLAAVDAVDVVRDGGACGQGGTLAGGRARGDGSGAARRTRRALASKALVLCLAGSANAPALRVLP